MDLNEYAINSSMLLIIAFAIMIFFGDYSWSISIFMIGISILLKLNQRDKFEPKLIINRSVSGKTFQEADRIRVILNIKNPTEYSFRGELADELPNSSYVWEGANVTLIYLKPFQEIKIEYVFSFPRRGKYTIGPIHIRYHSLGENYEKTWIKKKLFNFVIIPNPEPVSSYNLPPSFLKALGGPFRSKLVGDGIDFTGVRQYRPGDTLKRINWKQTAKNQILHTNEFEINRATDVIIVLDLTEETIEISDSSVRAALGLADYLIHSRCRVGIITLGEFIHLIPPKIGKRHLLEISEHLTNVKSINQIAELELFKQRLNEVISKCEYSNNEILLFSSLNKIENALLLANTLPKLGKVTVLSPSGTIIPTHDNELLKFSHTLLEMRKNVIMNYLRKRDIRIFEWIPELPFDRMATTWRSR